MFLKNCRRYIVIFIGIIVTCLGLILMPVPGPGGTPTFLAGLAILATEFKWARNFLIRFKEMYLNMGKTKRRVLTTSLLLFYLASGVIAWSWMNRADDIAIVEIDGSA